MVAAMIGLGGVAAASEARSTQPEAPAEKGAAPRPSAAPASAAEVLKSADRALREAESLSFSARSWGVGVLGTRSPEVSAEVRLKRAGKRDEFPWLFRVEGKATWTELARKAAAGKDGDVEAMPKVGTSPFVTAFDGKIVRTLRESQKLAIEGAWAVRHEALRDGAGSAIAWLLRWDELIGVPFGGDEPQLRARLEGTREIDGEVCDVVYVDFSDLNDPTLFDSWWMIARSDRLPRRIELNFRENAGDGFLVMSVKPGTSAAIEPAALALVAPEGWARREAKEPERRAGRGGGGGGGPPGMLKVGDAAPDFSLEDPKGKLHTLSDYRGKVVLLDFWATWCGPCQAVMPGMQKLHEKLKDRGLVVVGMNCWESGDPVKFMEDKGLSYLLLLKADEAAGKYMVKGIPTFYVIGPDGKIAHAEVGFNPAGDEALGAKIEGLLEKK